MTTVRDLAINCTAKLYAFRKTREGVIVQFVLDPVEVPAKLQTDHIGTSYMMALVEIDDATGQPKGGEAADRTKEPTVDAPPQSQPAAAGARRPWNELTPAQQAGIICGEKGFWRFLNEDSPSRRIETADQAAEFVRRYCGVKTRSDIREGDKSNDLLQDIVHRYRDWQRFPEYA